MATKLNSAVHRETNRRYQGRNIIVTLAPVGLESEALIGFRLKGKRTQYICAVSALYTIAAMWHGQKLATAKKQARKDGISWRTAKKSFDKNNRIG